VLGGLLVQSLSWRWVFYVNVPLGILATLFAFFFLLEGEQIKGVGKFDPAGFWLAGIGLATLMYGLTEGAGYGWLSLNILSGIAIGMVLLVAFVIVELRVKEPMLDLRLLKNKLFRIINLSTLFSGAGFLGVLFLVPLFLQVGRGASPFLAGLTTFPEAIGVLTATQLVVWLYPRVGPRRLIAGGLTFVAVVMLFFCLVGLNTELWYLRILMFLCGFGMGFSFIPGSAAAFATISHNETGRASAFMAAQRQIGFAVGVAVVSSVLSFIGMVTVNAHGTVQPNLTAYHAAFVVSSGLVLIGAFCALFIRDSEAAATMKIHKKGESVANASAEEELVLAAH
jgi:MFS family permease